LPTHIKGLNFFKSVGLNGGSAIFTQGATLLLILLLSNMFGPDGLARFNVTLNTANTLAHLSQLGLSYTAMTYVARYHVQDPSYAKAVLVFCQNKVLALTSFAAVVVAIFSVWIATEVYGDAELQILVLIACVAAPVTAAALLQLNVLNGLQNYNSIFFGSSVAAIVMILAAGLGGIWSGVVGAAIGFAISTVLRASLLQFLIWRDLRMIAKSKVPSSEIWQRISSFAIPAGLSGLTLTLVPWITNAMLLKHAGLAEAGLFLSALTLRTAIFFIPQQIGSTFLPQYIRQNLNDPTAANRNFWWVMILMIAVSIAFALISIVWGKTILALFGSEFAAGEVYLHLLMLTVVFETASLAFSNRLAARERMWTVLLAYTWPKDLLLLLTAFFTIPIWKGTGLAVAYLVSAIFGFFACVALHMYHKFLSKPSAL
jgi:O-antigen/teichoic acid export membrane protein